MNSYAFATDDTAPFNAWRALRANPSKPSKRLISTLKVIVLVSSCGVG